MRMFTPGLFNNLILKRKAVMLNNGMDISRLVVYMEQVVKISRDREQTNLQG